MGAEEDKTAIIRKSITITPEPATAGATAFGPIVWLTANFAQKWFEDALNEARRGDDIDSVRREIIFAVCFAESYILEWVRDDILKKDFQRLSQYFPANKKRPANEKWKEIPKQLKKDGLISGIPELDKAKYWKPFTDLVEYRNGLVHASVSRPETRGQPVGEAPLPSLSTLNQIKPGQATRVVLELVRDFHQAAGIPVPSWLVDP